MRSERRRRVLDTMVEAGVDAVFLSRPANVSYVSGSRQVWAAGSRPFFPLCVVVAATGRVCLVSPSDDCVPRELRHEDLLGFSWNPGIVASRLGSVDRLGEARIVGTDGWGPGGDDFVRAVCPRGRAVDAGPLLARARALKTPDEIACISTAAAIAEAALTALIEAAGPGATLRQLTGLYLATIAGLGAPTAPSESAAYLAPPGARRPRREALDEPLHAGDLVVLNPGAMYAGYEALVARTCVVGRGPTAEQSRLDARCRTAMDAVLARCRGGAVGSDLQQTWASTGEPFPLDPIVWGVGLGDEPPVIGDGLGSGSRIEAGSVLAVQSWVSSPKVGGVLEQETVLVTSSGAQPVTRYRRGLAVTGGGRADA